MQTCMYTPPINTFRDYSPAAKVSYERVGQITKVEERNGELRDAGDGATHACEGLQPV